LSAAAPWARSSLLVGGSDPAADAGRVVSGQDGNVGVHVLVGTPGRTADTLSRLDGSAAASASPLPRLTWRSFDLLILDEADRLLDPGFAAHVGSVLARLPKQRRTGLFSATQTDAVAALARAGLRNAVRVRVSVAAGPAGVPASSAAAALPAARPSITPASLTIFAATVPVDAKPSAVAAFLAEVVGRRGQRVIVYFLTCACVDLYAAVLPAALKAGAAATGAAPTAPPPAVPLFPLHGRMKQRARDAAVSSFTACRGGAALLATDVAARGLDLPALDWTLQADAPQDPDAFVHRVGRSARAGRPGCALALLAPHEGAYVDFLKVRRVPLTPGGPPADLFGGWGARVEEEEAARAAATVDAPPFSFDPVVRAVSAALRNAASTDRAVMEAGTRAFVSYVRGYREHRCRFIFRAGDLPLGRLASASALLRLPRMPELGNGGGKGARPAAPPDLSGWAAAAGVDPDAVPFKDRAREKARRRRAGEVRAAAAAAGPPAPASTRLPATPNPARPPPPLERRLPAAKRRTLGARQDEDDFAADYALLRKRKRGKISEADLEAGLLRRGKEEEEGSDDGSDGGCAPPPVVAHPPAGGGGPRRTGSHKGGRRGGFVPARR